MVILQHHVDVKGVSSKRCFYRIERNPVGVGCCNFVLYLGCWNAKRLNFFFNVVIVTTGTLTVVLYFIILPSVVLN
jgi:hypothetical protein